MKSEAFYKELASFLKENDVNSATAIIMNELGTILVHDRNDFIVLLNASGVPAEDRDSDTELIQKFINNITTNNKLVIGSAFLVAHKNKTVGFDGEEEVNDAGVKAMNRAIKSYFDSRNFPDSADNYYSEAGGGGAWASALKEGAKFGSKIAEGQQKKKFGGLDMAKQQAAAKNKIVQAVLKQREVQRTVAQKKIDDAAKKRKMIIWIGVGGLALTAVVITTIVIIKNRKK